LAVSGRRLRVAILGAGTVGREVVRAFLETPARLQPADGSPLELAGVAVRDIARATAAGIPARLLTDAPAHLVGAQDVDIVVELMGGEEPARTLVAAALDAGRPVVTANKRLLARHGPSLEAIARRAESPLRFEATVAGGVPILAPLASDLGANAVTRVRGIVNGTTNFILSAMAHAGRSYGEALAAAQAAGYAEADPAADVEGQDAIEKLVILARLAFGAWLPPEAIPNQTTDDDGAAGPPGIIGVTAADIVAARAAGRTIKLLATAAPAGGVPGSIAARVVATAVPVDSPLGRTSGVLNRIEIDARPVGQVAFEGPGAGGAATSSAVIGDLIAIARGLGSTWAGLPEAGRGRVVAAEHEAYLVGPSGARYPVVD
jgi:homoserine dehydrogenase